jgi:hypothetical protein
MMEAGLECSIMGAIPSLQNRILLASLAFSLVLIVGYGADLVLVQRPTWMFADDLVLALGAAVVVFYYERERSRSLSERLRVIRDMNSFVRNELQILYACLENPGKTRVSTIERSVERIDWALRELLPGTQPTVGTPVNESRDRQRDKIQRSA